MEKIIYLEPDDEITTVIDKIKRVTQDRVILVVPKAATILQSIVNLKILKKEAARLGKNISVVTSDETGRNLASQIGLTVYRDLAKRPIPEAERPVSSPQKEEEAPAISQGTTTDMGAKVKPEEETPLVKDEPEEVHQEPKGMMDIRSSAVKFKPYRDEKRAGLGMEAAPIGSIKLTKKAPGVGSSFKILKLMAVVLAVILILEGVLAYFYLPKANVKLTLKAEKFDKTYEVTAQKDAVSNEATATLPAKIYTVEKEGSKDLATTGTKDVGEKARGTIAASNETGVDQSLVATTRFVSSNGLVFRSTTAVTVPKAYLDAGGNKINGTVNVSVVADVSGEAYNIGPSSFTIPGLPAANQNKIYGRSSAGMSGGSTRKVKIVSEADITQAQSQFLAELVAAGKDETLAKADQEDLAVDGSSAGAVISSSSSPNVGAEAETFKYTLKASVNVITVKKSDLYGLLTTKINQEITADKELLPGELEKSTVNKATAIDLASGKMVVSCQVQAPIVAKMDIKVIKNNIKGKSKGSAVAYLISFQEISNANVSLWPFFALKVSHRPARIFIETSYQLEPDGAQKGTGQ